MICRYLTRIAASPEPYFASQHASGLLARRAIDFRSNGDVFQVNVAKLLHCLLFKFDILLVWFREYLRADCGFGHRIRRDVAGNCGEGSGLVDLLHLLPVHAATLDGNREQGRAAGP